MALNGGALNSHPVNNSAEGLLLGGGVVIQFEQTVYHYGEGVVAEFEQDVQLELLSGGDEDNVIQFEQVVYDEFSGIAIEFEQTVYDDSIPDHYTRTGWDIFLTIGGYQIPSSQIHGVVDITRTENDAALMTFTLIPPTGVQNVEAYHGKSVTLDARTSNGTKRIYTGTIDIPEIDLIEEKITFQCTDRRTEQINAQLGSVVQGIGVYSDAIFSETKDVAQEVEQRLTTTPHALDFDAYGNYTITSWYPKTTADYTLTDSDIYRDYPRVELASRGRVTNKINIKMEYRYERFHHHTRTFNWESPIFDDICLLISEGYTMTHKSAVLSAINSAGWPLVGEVDFEPIHESGWYWCDGYWQAWSTLQQSGETIPDTDENGDQKYHVNEAGESIYEYTYKVTGGTDYGDLYCEAAYWKASTRWAQVVTEEYSLVVQSPQSISQYGTIEQDMNYSLEQEAASAEWENYNAYTPSDLGLNYYINQDLNRSEARTAIDVVLRQAKNIILGSHRDTRVTVDTFLWPEVDLKHTVEIDTDEVEAKGKVWQIQHTIDIANADARTKTTVVLFRAQGSTSESSLTIPSAPSDSVTYNTQTIRLGNHFGEDPTTEAAQKWTGMIGNRWWYLTDNQYRTSYPESFVVDVPAIPNAFREARTLSKSASYNIEIPNDTLVITFDGKH